MAATGQMSRKCLTGKRALSISLCIILDCTWFHRDKIFIYCIAPYVILLFDSTALLILRAAKLRKLRGNKYKTVLFWANKNNFQWIQIWHEYPPPPPQILVDDLSVRGIPSRFVIWPSHVSIKNKRPPSANLRRTPLWLKPLVT